MTGCVQQFISFSAARNLRRLAAFFAPLVLLANDVRAAGNYADPLQPSEATEISAVSKRLFFQIPARLKQVGQEIARENLALNALAPLQVGKQFDQFGYHSDYIPAVDGVPDAPLWTLDFGAGIHPTAGFVMVPALDQRSSDLRGYAFPKRFRICSIDAQGQSDKVYVDWTTQDFPDPGMRPVYFGFPLEDAPSGKLRLEVFAGHEENGLEFFALGRIHPVRQGEQQKVNSVSASSSFDSAPYWKAEYLASTRHTLGMPLSAKKGDGGNLVLKLPAAQLERPLVIRIELDETDELGWINLFPGQSPDGIDVPGYGFPKEIRIYRLVQKQDQNGLRRFFLPKQDVSKNPGNNMLRLAGFGKEVAALEIECNKFPVYQGQAVFSLGEIEVIKSGRNLSKGRPVTIRGVELEERSDLGALVDGKVGGRDILLLHEWLQQLAAGKTHEARLDALNSERVLLMERWGHIRKVLLVSLGILLFAGVGAFVLFMLYSRKREQIRLRRQINSDLHDDVGSSLGSISLIAEQLQHAEVNTEVREDLCDLALMAREAWASLREVVWAIDEESIRLPMLIQKLTERATRVLGGVELSVNKPEVCPDAAVSLTFKRHIIMYFKEVVHNCARHAQATQVWLDFAIVDQHLQISVRDNGCGFDLTERSSGLGLDSLRNRAREMGGELELNSQPGEGTLVVLSVPLKALLNQTDHSYKTSN